MGKILRRVGAAFASRRYSIIRRATLVLIAERLILGFAVWAAASQGAAHGQPRRAARHPQSLFFLLAKPVQDELQLSPEQVARAAKLAARYCAGQDAAHTPMDNRSGSPRDDSGDTSQAQASAAPREPTQAFGKANYEQLAVEILDADQKKRLAQLLLQARGVAVFSDAKVAAQLQLTPEEKADISDLIKLSEQRCAQVIAQLRSGAIRADQAMKQVREIRRKAREDAFAQLSPAHQTRLRSILGPKPDFEPAELRVRLIRQVEPGEKGKPVKLRVEVR